MNERIRVIVTREQLDYLAEKAKLELIAVSKRNGDYDLVIRENEKLLRFEESNKEVRDGEW